MMLAACALIVAGLAMSSVHGANQAPEVNQLDHEFQDLLSTRLQTMACYDEAKKLAKTIHIDEGSIVPILSELKNIALTSKAAKVQLPTDLTVTPEKLTQWQKVFFELLGKNELPAVKDFGLRFLREVLFFRYAMAKTDLEWWDEDFFMACAKSQVYSNPVMVYPVEGIVYQAQNKGLGDIERLTPADMAIDLEPGQRTSIFLRFPITTEKMNLVSYRLKSSNIKACSIYEQVLFKVVVEHLKGLIVSLDKCKSLLLSDEIEEYESSFKAHGRMPMMQGYMDQWKWEDVPKATETKAKELAQEVAGPAPPQQAPLPRVEAQIAKADEPVPQPQAPRCLAMQPEASPTTQQAARPIGEERVASTSLQEVLLPEGEGQVESADGHQVPPQHPAPPKVDEPIVKKKEETPATFEDRIARLVKQVSHLTAGLKNTAPKSIFTDEQRAKLNALPQQLLDLDRDLDALVKAKEKTSAIEAWKVPLAMTLLAVLLSAGATVLVRLYLAPREQGKASSTGGTSVGSAHASGTATGTPTLLSPVTEKQW